MLELPIAMLRVYFYLDFNSVFCFSYGIILFPGFFSAIFISIRNSKVIIYHKHLFIEIFIRIIYCENLG